MKDVKATDDDFFKEVMSKTRLNLPFSDFEDNVMAEIENRISHQNSLSKEVKLSWIFFTVGSVFGIILSCILIQVQEPIFGINPNNLTVIFAVVFATALFTQIDTLLKLSKRINSKE